MVVAYNPETGKALRLEGGQWVDAPLARNPDTGALAAFDGAAWVSVGGDATPTPTPAPSLPAAPAGAPALAAAAPARGDEPGAAGSAPAPRSGVVSNVAAGANEVIADTLGAPVDAVNWAMGKIGLPVSDAPVLGSEWIKRRMGDAGFDPRDVQAVTTGEKIARGASRGAAQAASVALPAGAVAGAARGGPMARGVAETLATQPVTQAVSGAVGGGVGEATGNPLLGAAAGLAVPLAGAAAARAVSPVRPQLTPEQQRLADVAAREGIDLTTAQRTGSRPLQTLESVFGTLPMTAGPQQAVTQAQRAQFNRAVLSRAGIDADAATPDVLDAARRRLGEEFERLTARTAVPLDDTFMGDLQRVVKDYSRKLPSQQREVFTNYVDDIMNAGNVMDGARYQMTRSDLTRQSKAVANSDPSLSRALSGLRDALDEAANRAIPAADREAWDDARRQYAHLQTIGRAMSNTTADAGAGNIPPTQLSQAVRQSSPRAFAYGSGELNDLARVGQAFIRPQVPNSGTAERSQITSILTGGGAAGGAAVAGADPLVSLGVGGAALFGPRAVQELYNSAPVRAYLTNRLAEGRGPTVDRALIAAILAGQTPGLLDAGRGITTGLLALNR